MDITLPLDQSSYGLACSPINPTNFKQKIQDYEEFSLKKQRFRVPFSKSRCSLLEHGLKPRPMPKPLEKEEIDFRKGRRSEELDLRNSNLSCGVCAQIEKLVLCKMYKDALELFEILECEDGADVKSETYDALVGACIGLRSIGGVKRVFNHMINSGVDLDLYMMNRVLLMHVKCGMMIDARHLFYDMPERNVVSWNTIIGGLLELGDFMDAFKLFLMMREDNSDVGTRTFALMIRASAGLELISPGEQLHACALKTRMADDVFVSCALIDMYSKCGNVEDARLVFDIMPVKTTVAWNSIIAGYAFHGFSEEALSMYYEMQDSGVKMDHFTYSTIVRVCARLASLERGKQAHAGLVRNGFGSDVVANTALIDLYSKWGRIEDAQNVFDRMPKRNIISWNALIFGYGFHGRAAEAIELFNSMVREGIMPNHITFLAVLSACCYSGLSDRGWEIFESMSRDYKVKPRAMHYACMVELLGREGVLDEAFTLIRDAPFRPSVNMWAALLTACRVHKNSVLGKYAAEKMYMMGPEKLSNYVVLLNIFNEAGNLQEAAEVFHTLKRKGLRVSPTCTWIEVKKQQHVFFTGDKFHPQSKEIYDKLDELMLKITKKGYVAQGKYLLPDVDKQEQCMVLHHSEKLAVSFGVISTPSLTPLQLVQSHRICDNCHGAFKLISTACSREIVVRDGGRFHHFRDGRCSCGDYW